MKKRIVFLILLLLLMTAGSFGAFTNSITGKPNADWWTGQTPNFDPAWAWAKEVETLLGGSDGTTGFDNILFNPTTQPTSTTGRLYYDSAGNVFKYYNSTEFVTLEAGVFTVSLDDAYSVGQTITVDAGTMTFTATDAANNDVMALVQADATGGTSVLTLTNAGTGAAVEFDSNSSGGDMLGSDSSWSISKTGAFVINGSLTFSTADVLFDSTSAGKDVQFDESAQMMHFLDGGAASAILGFGGSADGAADISFIYDGSGDDLNITGSGKEIAIGATGNAGLDFIIWGLSGDLATFGEDESALSMTDYDIWMDDTADFFIGGTKNVGFVVAWDSSKTMSILAGAASDDFTLNIGQDQQGVDLGLYGSTASSKVLWDADADKMIFNGSDLRMSDGDIHSYGDSDDITLTFDGGNGDLDVLGSGLEWSFGVTDEGMDVVFHGEVAGDHMLWDEGIDALVFEDSHIKFDDDAVMYVGTKTNNQTLDGDFKMESLSDTSWLFTAVVANSEITIGDGTIATDFRLNNITTDGADFWWDQSADSAAGTIFIGEDGKGIDTKFFGDAASSYVLWDQSADQLNAVDSDVVLDDESLFVDIIDTTGTKVEVGTPFYIIFKPTADETLTYTVPAAYDLLIIDAWGYKTAGAGANADDEWNLFNNEGGAASIFAQVELNGVGDGDRVAFTDLDDAEAEVNGGQVLSLDADENAGNGCDGIIVVSCTLKLTD